MRPYTLRWASAVAALASTERWLLPGECLLCRGPAGGVEEDPLVCQVCRHRWRPVPEPRCGRCGQPTDRSGECRVCAAWPPEFEAAASAVSFDERVRLAIHLFKYEGWRRLAETFAAPMRRLAPLRRGGVLVPIPLGTARARSRGYNQSALLAECLARETNLAVAAHLLRRTRETATQTSLPPEAREANVRGAFAAVEPCPARVVLVDDVFTTGATLVAAVRALAARGARQVAAITFARAELPLAAVSRSAGPVP